jgi:uncharacterized membrane protein
MGFCLAESTNIMDIVIDYGYADKTPHIHISTSSIHIQTSVVVCCMSSSKKNQFKKWIIGMPCVLLIVIFYGIKLGFFPLDLPSRTHTHTVRSSVAEGRCRRE